MRTIIAVTATAATALLIAVMALTPGQPVLLWVDKADHAAAFGALALVLYPSLRSERAVLATCCAASAMIEIVQGAIPRLGRQMSFADFVFGVLGALAVLSCLRMLRLLARPISSEDGDIPDRA